VTEHVIHIW